MCKRRLKSIKLDRSDKRIYVFFPVSQSGVWKIAHFITNSCAIKIAPRENMVKIGDRADNSQVS